MIKLSTLKPNPDNPRTISEERVEKLAKSIEEFPKMMELRPIVVDEKGVILGGNMRFEAILRSGKKEIPNTWVKSATKLSEDERRRFIIEDNVGFGDWGYDALADWDSVELLAWGVSPEVVDMAHTPEFEPDTGEGQSELDKEARLVKCPECGHEWAN